MKDILIFLGGAMFGGVVTFAVFCLINAGRINRE